MPASPLNPKHNKTLLAQATPAGTAYYVVRPKAGRYAAPALTYQI